MKKYLIILFVALATSLQAQHTALLASTANQAVDFDISGGIARGYELDLNESNAQDIFWLPDGSMFWTIGATNDNIKEWTPTTNYRIEGATNTGTFSVSTYEVVPTGLWWHPDGDFFFICGLAGDNITRYDVSTTWDVTTATYVEESSAFNNGPYGLEFEPDGLGVWCAVDFSSFWRLRRYALSTAWDVTTLSTSGTSELQTEPIKPSNFGWNTDATQLWIGSENDGMLYTYDMDAYELSTAVETASQQTVYTANFRAAEMIQGRNDIFYVGGAGSNVEMKEYTFLNGVSLGATLTTNGDFATDTYWSKGSGWTISGGTASYDGTGGTSNLSKSSFVTTLDTEYIISVKVVANSGTGANDLDLGSLDVQRIHLPVDTWYYRGKSNGTGTLQIYGRASETFEIDDFNVYEIK